MPKIVVALQFEAELVDYFEVTYQWHAYPGELCTRPGFRMIKLHHLMFEYIMPFWESATANPKDQFKNTFELIEKMESSEDEDQKRKGELKRDQIMFCVCPYQTINVP